MAVTADYLDAEGNLLWREAQHPFKRMFSLEQEVYQGFGTPKVKRFYVLGRVFDGVFGNGNVTYVVTPNWTDILEARKNPVDVRGLVKE